MSAQRGEGGGLGVVPNVRLRRRPWWLVVPSVSRRLHGDLDADPLTL